MSKTMQFHVLNATCPVCVENVRTAFEEHHFPEVESLSSNGLRKTITITLNESGFNEENTFDEVKAKFLKAFADTGYKCDIDRSENNHFFKAIIGVISIFVGAALIALSLSGLAIPLSLLIAIVGLSSLLTLFLGLGSYIDAIKKLFKSKKLTMDTLFSISTLTVIGVSIASFFVPWLPMVLETGVLIFAFRLIGDNFKEEMREGIAAKLSFKDRAPKNVERKNTLLDKWEICSTDNLEIGDIIRVNEGQFLPVDGKSKSKNARLLTSIKDGSISPARIKKNEEVLAGMKVCSDNIEVLVLEKACDSFLSKLDQSNEYLNEKAPIQMVTEKIMQFFVPTIIILGTLSGILVGFLFNPALGIQCAISLFVSACPCTLGLADQIAFMIGLYKAMINGLRFKSNYALQQADDIDVVVFDITRTITKGIPEVVAYEIYSEESISLDDFFDSLAAIEKHSNHVVAKAIIECKPENYRGSESDFQVSDVDTSHHSGIKAIVNGDTCLVGNSHFLSHHHIKFTAPETDTGHIIYYVRNDEVLGYVEVQDPLRDDAEVTIRGLKRMGKKVYLCTGLGSETAQFYARLLEIDSTDVLANMAPIPLSDSDEFENDDINSITNKLQFIQYLQEIEHQRVAMVGDEVNDAPAVKQSNFGIALTTASDPMTRYEADAVTESSSLLPIITAFAVAKETIINIKLNLIFSLVYNVVIAFVAVGFALNPAIGVALMVLQFAIVLGVQLLIMNHQLPHLKEHQEEKKTSMFASFFGSKKLASMDSDLLLPLQGGGAEGGGGECSVNSI